MKNFHPTGNCPVRDVLSRLGDKWSMLVLITLSANGTMRFSDIDKTIADVSQRMLTVTLRTLESDGLIERKVYAEVPPRVEYCLTERGLSLIPHIQGLVDWALQQMSAAPPANTRQIIAAATCDVIFFFLRNRLTFAFDTNSIPIRSSNVIFENAFS